MNRGNITPRPEYIGGISGFPETVLPGGVGMNEATPWGLISFFGVPQTPFYAPTVSIPVYFDFYPFVGV